MRGVSGGLVEPPPQMSQILSLVPFKWPLQDTSDMCSRVTASQTEKRRKSQIKEESLLKQKRQQQCECVAQLSQSHQPRKNQKWNVT